MIDLYEFGHIVIDGKHYRSDVIIYSNKIDGHWWRKEGHLLLPEDLKEVVKEKPEILIIGTGNSGLMKVPSATLSWVKSKKIKVYAESTQKACQIYNRLCNSNKVIAAFHLTC
ncbi:MAG: MTH938/NDUFAF3 family protein [Candidatus Aerophobetes bacterium]|nr:MTH938/NDUFAF3 family protein [Candidatus Aerophobetes bacterium]